MPCVCVCVRETRWGHLVCCVFTTSYSALWPLQYPYTPFLVTYWSRWSVLYHRVSYMSCQYGVCTVCHSLSETAVSLATYSCSSSPLAFPSCFLPFCNCVHGTTVYTQCTSSMLLLFLFSLIPFFFWPPQIMSWKHKHCKDSCHRFMYVMQSYTDFI